MLDHLDLVALITDIGHPIPVTSFSSSSEFVDLAVEAGKSSGSNCASNNLRNTSCALSTGGGVSSLALGLETTVVSLFRFTTMVDMLPIKLENQTLASRPKSFSD